MNKLIKLSDTHYIIVNDSRKSLLGKNYSKYYLGYDYKIYSIDDIGNKPVIGQVTHSTEPLDIKTIPSKTANIKKISWVKIKPISLSEVEEAIYGYSVKKMAWKLFGGSFEARNVDSEEEANKVVSFGIECIKAHQELVKDKLFTIDDMRKAFIAGVDWQECGTILYPDENGFIQSLLPKTEWDIEFVDGKIKLI